MDAATQRLDEARRALEGGEAAKAVSLCNETLLVGGAECLCAAWTLKARALLALNKLDEAVAAAKAATGLLPDAVEGWEVLNEILERKLAWQTNLQVEPADFNETLQDMTGTRAEIVCGLTGRSARQAQRVAPPVADNLLEQLAAKYRPSKVQHDYIRHFWRHFRETRLEVRKFCEIGLADHKGEKRPDSLMMWEEFFPNAEIWGVDINPECRSFEGGRRKILIGDQKDPGFLRHVAEATGGDLDIIVDDGEHSNQAILTSLTWLLGALNDHGMYVIEDLMYQRRVQQFLLHLANGVSHWPAGHPFPDWPYLYAFDDKADWLRKNITGVAFYRFLCFIMRGYNPEDNPYLRPKPAPKG
ncbi:MAG: hypothetical protein Q7I92_14810 [Humidesulfovibrio sp.]|nr:hypothetical protein [Humidesulfovibrio sp.]